MEQATRIEPATASLGIEITASYFHNLQNRLEKINVHAVSDLHMLRDVCGTVCRIRFSIESQA